MPVLTWQKPRQCVYMPQGKPEDIFRFLKYILVSEDRDISVHRNVLKIQCFAAHLNAFELSLATHIKVT